MLDYTPLVYLGLITILTLWLIASRKRARALAEKVKKRERERKATFAFLNDLGDRIMHDTIALEPTLEVIVEFLVEITGAESGAAFLLDEDTNTLSARVVNGTFPPMIASVRGVAPMRHRQLTEWIKRQTIALGEGVVGEVAQTGEPILISDASIDPRISQNKDTVETRNLLLAPLVARGKVSGVLVVANKRGVGSFQPDELDMLVSLADQAASTVELVKLYAEQADKQKMEQELRVAHDFQQMLLPPTCPQPDGFRIAAFSAPAQQVGGDYYDLFYIDDEERYLGVAVADVSGKGIPGALIMAVVRCTTRAMAQGNFSPRDVMIKVNERIVEDTKDNVFVTMTYGILDTKESTFRFVRAGHEPVLTTGIDGQPIRLSSPAGMAMGLVGDDIFSMLQEQSISLGRGEMAVMYTDGVIEAMDRDDNEYGQQKFFDLLSQNHGKSPQEIIEITLQDIRDFTKGYPQHDDITLLAIQVIETQSNAINQSPELEPSAGA